MAERRTRRAPNPGRVLNYSTTIDPQKSVNEIQAVLVAHGARRFTLMYDDDRKIDGIHFTLDVNGTERAFEIKANWQQVRKRLIENHNKGKRSYQRGYWEDKPGSWSHSVPATVDDQSKRVAWRVLKDAVEVMVNLVSAGIADVGQVFFGFGVLDSGLTIYEAFVEDQKALPGA